MADDEGGAGVEDSCACCRLKPSDTQVHTAPIIGNQWYTNCNSICTIYVMSH